VFPGQDGYAERQLRGWSRQSDSTRTRDLPIIERTADALLQSIPAQREIALVHGDYNLSNLIVGADGEVRAILDWELSTLGDPWRISGRSSATGLTDPIRRFRNEIRSRYCQGSARAMSSSPPSARRSRA
jgi:aminoglycoside phosphotransferase (APT) family kinase protein